MLLTDAGSDMLLLAWRGGRFAPEGLSPSPHPPRSLETIFEEPKEKNGALVCIGQQKRKRVLDFPDFTLPRKRRARAGVVPTRAKVTRGRGRRDGPDDADLDVMLIERLSELEDYFSRQGLED